MFILPPALPPLGLRCQGATAPFALHPCSYALGVQLSCTTVPLKEAPCTMSWKLRTYDPQQVPGVACLLSSASSCPYFTAAFLGVAVTSKEFQWYLIYDVTSLSLYLAFCFLFVVLRPHIHLGFYAFQSR